MKILNKNSEVGKKWKFNCELCGFEREMGAPFHTMEDAIWFGNGKVCEKNGQLIEGFLCNSAKWPIMWFDFRRKMHQFVTEEIVVKKAKWKTVNSVLLLIDDKDECVGPFHRK